MATKITAVKATGVHLLNSDESSPTPVPRIRLNSWDLNLSDQEDEYGPEDIVSRDAEVNIEQMKEEDQDEVENSPYAEVRAAVPNSDKDLPANTIRAWVLGILLSMIGAAVNTVLGLRQPSINLGVMTAQLLAYLLGKAWARWVPSRDYDTFRLKWNLNPGPFNVKEHSIIGVMVGVSFHTAFATDIILAQVVFYKQDFGMAFQVLLVITTQSIGYGIAGLLRKFLIYPAAMIWPESLVAVSLMHAMHDDNEELDPTVLGGNMSRFKWFGIIALVSYLYHWIPGFLAQFLSIFAFMTWIYPKNPVINQIFGGTTGLGLLPITFDWTIITGFTGSPMIPPWHAIANTLIGVVSFYIIGTAGLHYGGSWYSKFLPISDSSIYDNTGKRFNVSMVTTSHLTLDEAAYKAYSPLYLSTTFAVMYGLSFATISSLVVYTWLNHRHEIMRQFRNSKREKPDIHMKMMLKYPEAPMWWYLVLFALMLALSLVVVLAWATEFAWWAFLISIIFATVMTLPVGIIHAITNQHISLNVITEFIMGYMQPGKPIALMMFKTYGNVTVKQSVHFIQDLKFGHYMKIPPRTMFTAQVVATTVACIVQVYSLNFALTHIDGICTLEQEQRFTCPGGRVFFSASVVWGLLGPQRIFNPGQTYSALLWFFPLGAALSAILHFAAKRWPKSPLKYAMAPVILGGASSIPPASPMNYLAWGAVGCVFQWYIRTRHLRWWSRLNYITAMALSTGLALSTITIFLIFTLNHIDAPHWWGNSAVRTTMDVANTAVQAKAAPGDTFGPKEW